MKLTAAVTFFQICALYVLLGCSPTSTAPSIMGKVHATIKPYYADYNKFVRQYNVYHDVRDVHEPLETLDEKIGENVSTSDTTPVIGIISDDNTATNYGYSQSKQKDFKYDQFQLFLETLTSASSKFKEIALTNEQPFVKELTTNSFTELVTTEMLQTKHPSSANKTKLLYPRTELATTPLNTSYIVNITTTTMWPLMINLNSTTLYSNFTTTEIPITTTTQKPKPNKLTCTLCIIIVVNE